MEIDLRESGVVYREKCNNSIGEPAGGWNFCMKNAYMIEKVMKSG